jgi:hypothetical protein
VVSLSLTSMEFSGSAQPKGTHRPGLTHTMYLRNREAESQRVRQTDRSREGWSLVRRSVCVCVCVRVCACKKGGLLEAKGVQQNKMKGDRRMESV